MRYPLISEYVDEIHDSAGNLDNLSSRIPSQDDHGKPMLNYLAFTDGFLTLVDDDGMFVHAMKGQTSTTVGTKDFRHALRTKTDLDKGIDDFSLS